MQGAGALGAGDVQSMEESMTDGNPYNVGLDKTAANYTPLSPLSMIARSAYVYPQRIAVIHGGEIGRAHV